MKGNGIGAGFTWGLGFALAFAVVALLMKGKADVGMNQNINSIDAARRRGIGL